MRFLLALLLFARVALGDTYFIDDDRPDDTGDGLTAGAAWKTVAKVNSLTFSPSDIIQFDKGNIWQERLTFPSSGSAGNYITITSYGSGALPILEAATGRAESIVLTGKTYVKASFLNLRGGDAASNSGLIESDSITNLIEDCTIDAQRLADNCIGGSSTVRRTLILNGRDDGFTMHGNDSGLVEFCTFSGNQSAINLANSDSQSMSLTVNDSLFDENGDGDGNSGDVNQLAYGTFAFNRINFNGRADGAAHRYISLGDGSNVTVSYARVNNSRATSITFGSISVGAGAVLDLNNLTLVGGLSEDRGQLVANGAGAIINVTNSIVENFWRIKESNGGKIYFTNSIVHNTGGVDSPGDHVYTIVANVSTADPLFVSAATGNFRLQAGSPAINAGTNLGLTTDLTGRAVGNPPEIGAYEYFVGGNVTAGNLSVGTLSIGP